MMTVLRRVLNHRVSLEQLIELGLWLAIPYLLVGIGYAFVSADRVDLLETQLQQVLPAGANLAALGIIIALWPLLVLAPGYCTV